MVNNISSNGFIRVRKFSGISFKKDISDSCLMSMYDFIKTSCFPQYLVLNGLVYCYNYCFEDRPYFRCVYTPSSLKVSQICKYAIKNECYILIEYCDEF